MTLRLRLASGETIDVDRTFVVGRLPDADLTIPDPLISGRHLEVSPTPNGAQVVDLQSSNGTFVNGERITGPRTIVGGDEIAIGSQRITVEVRREETADDPMLSVRVGPDTGLAVPITGTSSIVVGRAEDASLRLSDPLVSAHHCTVVLVRPPAGPCPGCGMQANPGDAHCVGCGRARVGAKVEDLGSANGVLVNGAPVPKGGTADLPEGGEIQVGESVIVLGDAVTAPASGPAPTVIRAIPEALRDPQPAVALPQLPTARRRSTALLAVLAVAAIGLVGLVALVVRGDEGGSAASGQRDAAWIRENRGPMTVQVAADDGDGAYVGSGSIIDLDGGLVLTNFHVYSDEEGELIPGLTNSVRLDGSQSWLAAELIGYSACDDLALLRVDGLAQSGATAQVQFADPSSIVPGETVVALGFPGTLESSEGNLEQLSLTQGIVSKVDASIENLVDVIQIDADLNPGNSGGPLFDLEGNQIGVNTAGDVEGTQGINYAINIRHVNEVLPGLRGGERQDGYAACPA